MDGAFRRAIHLRAAHRQVSETISFPTMSLCSDWAGRNANHDQPVVNVACHHGTSTDHHIGAHATAFKNNGACTNVRSRANRDIAAESGTWRNMRVCTHHALVGNDRTKIHNRVLPDDDFAVDHGPGKYLDAGSNRC